MQLQQRKLPRRRMLLRLAQVQRPEDDVTCVWRTTSPILDGVRVENVYTATQAVPHLVVGQWIERG